MKNKKDKAQESCGCGSENCHCGDDCNCTKDNKCSDNCTCDHEHGECGCGHDHGSAEEFKAYKRAFEEFEEALEKIDLDVLVRADGGVEVNGINVTIDAADASLIEEEA